ncbi:hypothetical protein CANARDRAFT_200464 [[Candida] arabinofermentans NRRL YB-2248]|uniref:aspartyl aminopeptidase n=1 Tax=[Candida] arabinofermentans NRRL YB-2248 TaxID=983967 RepID=A0A1E4SYR2_9ASCO|nr:hypothetical protein CANARDRAFT_200464 [[Candida] arabinofermentans NRRL YB-2248]
MSSSLKYANNFLNFVNASPTPYHVVDTVKSHLKDAGFIELSERYNWAGKIKKSSKFFVTRNASSLIAFTVGGLYQPGNGIAMVGGHTDSPVLRIKPISNSAKEGYIQIGVETYGGGIWHTWFDRDLSIAGRVFVTDNETGNFVAKLVKIEKPLLRIPTLAIHLTKDRYVKFEFNKETQFKPIAGLEQKTASLEETKESSGCCGSNDDINKEEFQSIKSVIERHNKELLDMIAKELSIEVSQIEDFELVLYDTQKSCLGGLNDDFIFSPRLDNQVTCYCATQGLINSSESLEEQDGIQLISLFDHEEVGSLSAQGADSSFLPNVLERLTRLTANPDVDLKGELPSSYFLTTMSKSFMISSDMAHGVHPNYTENYESLNKPKLNSGPVIKVNANQRYVTNSAGVVLMKKVGSLSKTPLQLFVVRNDSPCGSTIGPMISAKLGVRTLDLGNPQLSMHSIRETCGSKDIELLVLLFESYFEHYSVLEPKILHMSQSSSLITFPNVITDSPEITFDVDKFEKMLKIHCNTKTHLVSDTDAQHELPRFIDTRKRLLRIDLSPLEDSFTAEERLLKLQEYDELFKELIRRLPSPNHSVILTSSTPRKYVDPQEKIYDVQDIPMDPRNLSPEIRRAVKTSKTMIFPDISIFDMTRYLDFERNKHNERAELVGDDQEIPNGQWAKDLEVNGGSNEHDDTWLSKKSKSIKKEKSLYRFGEDSNDFMRILDRQTLLDNSLTIAFGVLANGAIPATIAFVDGVPKVGLDEKDLAILADHKNDRKYKISRRDVAYIMANGLTGGTTIASTMMLAHKANIDVFATGGLGGVSRPFELMDVSADLDELSKTPVAVVCSGPKSILDVRRTMEYLETKGVPVATYLDQSNPAGEQINVPGFYTRDSGNGYLFCIPPPVDVALPAELINNIIEETQIEADKLKVFGKDLTPFMLGRINQRTNGISVKCNVDFVKNNAITGAKIAKELSYLRRGETRTSFQPAPINLSEATKKQKSSSTGPVSTAIVGSIALDSTSIIISSTPSLGDSNPSKTHQSPGGVGFNVALACNASSASSSHTLFISAVNSNDIAGQTLLQTLRDHGLSTDGIFNITESGVNTAQYTSIHDSNGDLIISCADMSIVEKIPSDHLNTIFESFEKSDRFNPQDPWFAVLDMLQIGSEMRNKLEVLGRKFPLIEKYMSQGILTQCFMLLPYIPKIIVKDGANGILHSIKFRYTMTSANSKLAPGRVETLTPDQEKVLKQVWMYYLHFSGYHFPPPSSANASSARRNTLSSMKSNDTAVTKKSATTLSTATSSGKKKGLLGKLKRGHGKKKSIDETTQREIANHSSSDPAVRLTTDLSIHSALKDLNPEAKTAFWDFLRHDSPDNLLLRFVRARKWDVDKSLLMISHTLKWRLEETHVDSLLFKGELGLVKEGKMGVINQFASGKCVIRGKDKNDRPMVIIRPKFHHSSDQTEEEVELYTLLIIEYARLIITEPVDSCSVLFDLSGFTMANMDYNSVKFIVKAFEAHYPESLGVLFIHKAPWIFSGIWNIIKKWLDPVVASKIVFTKTTADLEKVIELKHIPKELGGEDDYEWNYHQPTEEKNGLLQSDDKALAEIKAKREELISDFIALTIEWIECYDKEKNAELLSKRIELGKELGQNYVELDGYIRNRGIYDILGQITFKNN